MSKMANRWETPISTAIPYLQWSELSDGELNFWETGRHNHAAYELHIILQGQCKLFINNAEMTLSAGQGIFISPEVYHGPDAVAQPFGRFSVTFQLTEALAESLLPPGDFLAFQADDDILRLCDSILREMKQPEDLFHKELLSNRFGQLMITALRAVKETAPALQGKASYPRQLEDMTVIDSFFATIPPKQRTKENLAQLLNCSQRQALRKIYTLYGMSFQKKLLLSRIETAQHLLRTTDKSVDAVCEAVGYADKAAFYKAFKSHAGITPVRYRKAAKEEI
jgi:AraC-like DNA-binding protein